VGKGIHIVMVTLLQDECWIVMLFYVASMQGTPFADICELTDVSEGLIVRTIVRLDETCREFRNAASIMGNSALYKKMEVASNAIKRDIVFAASLYVTGI
jgi:antiviral helicase SKI2